MKKAVKAYVTFTWMERMGIVALLLLLAILIGVRCAIPYFVHPKHDMTQDSAVVAAWNKFQAENQHVAKVKADSATANFFQFDPNTLDSSGFIKLGMKEKAVHSLLNWRRKGKHFYKAEDLEDVYNLSEAEYKRLKPYISIAADDERE